ncbi:splicing factor, suppressor of white-apricot homolog isoform X2 [Pomacea canaliculata]|uniref:splicing factor, suppressor of white-apricot homolog isoform X2 n=1 Tax=Pomacea canaliculata TaxID=400727 RepID=UPI000D735EDA|nr:splicing factor, suppressor of white-apricot homolog isoform X2 [Pomacea canaliculata]XP_025088916.1 splicing factor, suppressor of white-apricot homolog isoform X2 [Pomacea canaliculata]
MMLTWSKASQWSSVKRRRLLRQLVMKSATSNCTLIFRKRICMKKRNGSAIMNPCKKVTKQLASAMISQFLEKEQKHWSIGPQLHHANFCCISVAWVVLQGGVASPMPNPPSSGLGTSRLPREFPDEQPAEEEKKFVPAEELRIPSDVEVPQTEKEHTRIEKTATFIAKHGIQMEIMVKAKQARNPQFEFLNFEHPLNQYYKHLVQMIKDGKYRPQQDQEEKEEMAGYDKDHYLHPSLSNSSAAVPLPPPPPPKPIIMPKISIHDTPYGQLITSFKKFSRVDTKEEKQDEVPDMGPPPLPPFMAQPDYGSSSPLHSLRVAGFHQRIHQSGLCDEREQPPPPGTEAIGPLPRPHSAGDLAALNEEDCGSAKSDKVPPPPDIQPIIDRMAMYVAKNGLEFEIVVKSKKDPRFAFLEPGHVHFHYYDSKKQMHIKEAKKKMEAEKLKEQAREKQEREEAAQANRSISFSIKGRSREPDAVNTLKRPLFDYDSSDGETEGDADGKEKGSGSPSSSPDVRGSAVLLPTNLSSTTSASVPATSDTKAPIAPEELERRQAEERLKDKLVAAARDKLMSTAREKQLQLERKRKAAMFINLLRIVKESPFPDEGGSGEVASEAKSSPTVTPVNSQPHSPLVFEYNNRSGTPVRWEDKSKRTSRSKSPSDFRKKRRTKSPTPPTAYSNPRRSPPRYSPAQRRSRSPRRPHIGTRPRISPLGSWSRRSPSPAMRSRSPLKRPSESPRKKTTRKSKSRSPSPTSSKHKKKHKRSRSKTPSKKKDRESDKSKEKEEKRKSKERRSKDNEWDNLKDKEKHKDKHKEKKKDKEKDKLKSKKDKHKTDDREKERRRYKTDDGEKDRSRYKKSSIKSQESGSKDSKTKSRSSSRQKEPSCSQTHDSDAADKSLMQSPLKEKSIERVLSPIPEVISSDSSSSSDEGQEESHVLSSVSDSSLIKTVSSNGPDEFCAVEDWSGDIHVMDC